MFNSTVVIAGGAGFLGSHLCDFLLARGCAVICVDSLVTGSLNNIQHLASNTRFTFIKHDIVSPLNLRQDIDYVLNFASPASPVDYSAHPIETLNTGAIGTLNLLELARQKKARFLLASSSEVYGDPTQHPQTEDYWGNVNPIGPRSVYDEAKRFAEALTMAYHRKHGMDTKIVRIFNTYGPRMRRGDGRAIPTFIEQALDNQPITVFGDGSQTRSFCYFSDLISGIYQLMCSSLNEPVNLGNPQETTLLELARTIRKLVGNDNPIVFRPLPQDDPKKRRPDITKARELLHWRPEISIEQGLESTIAWFRYTVFENKKNLIRTSPK